MQISKSFLALCATVACVAPLIASGVDTEAQAKARAALEQKLDELQSQDAPRVQPAAPAPKAKAVKKKKAAKAPVAPAPVAAQPAAACCVSTPATPAAKLPATPAVASAPAPKATTSALAQQPATAYHFATVSADAPSDPASVAKARQALWQEMDQLNQAKPAPAPVSVQTAPARTVAAQSTVSPAPRAKSKVAAKRVLVYQPIERPVSPLSADKQQRLSELLEQYKADQITPEQYQAQRAKILAEP